jgi:hypothetical protein
MTRSEGFGLSGKGVGALKPARTLRLFAFLACAFGLLGGQAGPARSAELEKDQLKIGFIKLTDMAPLAIANEKLFFEDEGLQVLLEAQANAPASFGVHGFLLCRTKPSLPDDFWWVRASVYGGFAVRFAAGRTEAGLAELCARAVGRAWRHH